MASSISPTVRGHKITCPLLALWTTQTLRDFFCTPDCRKTPTSFDHSA
jgi:hypothetical protein